MKVIGFFKKFGMGAVIGAAMIIPGVSGGTLAVLLNIYDKLINAISDLRKDFKNSFLFLLPIALGAVAAVAAMYFPLKFLLDKAPLPTVLTFAGLMLGSFPKVFKDGVKNGFKISDIFAVAIPLTVVLGVCFLPHMGAVNLGADMRWYAYILLLLVGMLASCALVIPGVSGSMLLLILGYYNSILDTVSALKIEFWHSALVLAIFALGIVAGFFSIAKLMKFLLAKFPRGTYWAIIGFVAGSIPAMLLTFKGNFPDALPLETPHIIVGIILFLTGAVLSYFFTAYVEAKAKKTESTNER